ncbi:SDR family NAD(P)-dependent oxidoreductase [Variovorax ginsengisoli]|uniref:SDR family oxidoreductase n=1 Tax=Variovorax ginsengisoli TaxID=363844 RepID=A0ABT8SEK5_9BURK|nr:SDR family oxidoreductase [Variovorax ginsengisoli]MDN8617427.1 SDR family oxidoreductase [Variovorax ginsengisoli]MDO1536597.1 SDR family oxidoreductase [Variovorax ginsengisoli]
MTTLASLFDLRGKAAFVAGASSGIGLHTARLLARAGASVALAARRADRLGDAVTQLKEAGYRACATSLDVTQPDSISVAWADAQQQLDQPLDILINNAGVIHIERFTDQSREDVTRIFDTNLKGAFLVAQEAARQMVAQGGGCIVNVASSAGLRASGHMSSYGASKAGLIHLTHIMALELAGKGVRVNALAPGNIRTDMQASFSEHGLEESIRKRIPMRRFGEPSDLDGAMLLLTSDAGRYITGAVLPVDGGQILSWM